MANKTEKNLVFLARKLSSAITQERGRIFAKKIHNFFRHQLELHSAKPHVSGGETAGADAFCMRP